MGRKTKKTKWRTLEISPLGTYTENSGSKLDDGQRTPPTNNNHIIHHYNNSTNANITATTNHYPNNDHNNDNQHQYERKNRRKASPSPSPKAKTSNLYLNEQESKVIVQDEYTKITTPRQDVLFKKGYLTRRKVPEAINENSVDQNNDGTAQDCCCNNKDFSDCANVDESVQYMCSGLQSYIDPTTLYYGGSYEIYDPYADNVTVIVGPGAGQYPSNSSSQPVLTSISCRPVPLQPVQWFNPVPSSDWCCSYSSPNDKRLSTDMQNGSGVSSESPGAAESPPEIIEETLNGNNSPVFPPSYVYPGYMFGAPIYNVDDINTQNYVLESPDLSTSELTSSKRKRKKKRRRRAEAEDKSESSFDDTCSRSISSTEFILDTYLQTESLLQNNFEDFYATGVTHSSAAVPFPSFPHPNVNAPEFVPTNSELSSSQESAKSPSDNNTSTSKSVSLAHNSELLSQKSSVLNVCCSNSFQHQDNKKKKQDDLESVSCSNNSDSGISSPGSEDISKNSFGKKESPSYHQTKEAKNKKAQSKKLTSKAAKSTKHTEEATRKLNQKTLITCIVPTYQESRKDFKATSDERRESKKIVASVNGKVGSKNNVQEIIVMESIQKLDKKKASRMKNAKISLGSGKTKSGVADTQFLNDVKTCKKENLLSQEVRSCARNLSLILIDEQNNDCICNNANNEMSSIGHISKKDEEQKLRITTCSDESSKILNRCVKIEEKPTLAKLGDLTCLTVEKNSHMMDNILSTSEFLPHCDSLQPARDRWPEGKLLSDNLDVEQTAELVINSIINCAKEQVLSSMSCDKLIQLPITEAVTKWLNEHGGLSIIGENACNSQNNERNNFKYDESSVKQTLFLKDEKRSRRLKQNCVIC